MSNEVKGVLKMTDLECRAADMLKLVGVPMHLDGYHYLRRAIVLTASRLNRPLKMMTDIYLVVGEEYGITFKSVERSCRFAIDKAFEQGDIDTLERIFGKSISAESGKVCNKCFVMTLAAMIERESRVG